MGVIFSKLAPRVPIPTLQSNRDVFIAETGLRNHLNSVYDPVTASRDSHHTRQLEASWRKFSIGHSTLYNATDRTDKRIIWVHYTKIGMEIEKQTLCEIAVIVTDSELNTIATGPYIVIHQPKEVLDKMEDWQRNLFVKIGLMDKIISSKYSMTDAENEIVKFLKLNVRPGVSPLAGNFNYMDRIVIKKLFPKVDEFASFVTFDASTIKAIIIHWYPYFHHPKMSYTADASSYLMVTIADFKLYKDCILVKSLSPSF